MGEENKDLIAKLGEYKVNMNLRMVDHLDGMIGLVAMNRDNICIKCLEAVLKYCEITKSERVTRKQAIDLAEDFYKFVKGE